MRGAEDGEAHRNKPFSWESSSDDWGCAMASGWELDRSPEGATFLQADGSRCGHAIVV